VRPLACKATTLAIRLFRQHRVGAGAARRPCRGCLVVALTVLLWGLSVGAFGGPPPGKADPYGYFDFPTCVRFALVHSERILQNRLEIQIRSADVKDAHAEILPTLELVTRYYIATAANNANAGQINVQIYMTNFNPLLALFKVKSTGILTDIATTTHYDKIAEAECHMAKLFSGVHFLEKSIRTQRQIAALLQNKVDYGRTIDRQGTADPLELKSWANSLKSRQIDIRDL
jgi:outer membrane protein TolC